MVGSALCNALIDLGDKVVGLSRDPEKAGQAQPAVEWHGWEPTKERPPAEAIESAERGHTPGRRTDQPALE